MGKASKQKAGSAVTAKSPTEPLNSKNSKTDDSLSPAVKKELIAEHLPPISLVFTVIACSGFLLMFAFRDVFATGRNIAGEMDEAYLQFTKSVVFFDNSKGWKSQQGGLSTIQPITTDANNMGGLFVRKLGGAANLAFQFQKLMPVLIHPWDARWKHGHFRPVFWMAVTANVLVSAFYAYSLPDLAAAGADGLPKVFMSVLAIESMVILYYLYASRKVKVGPAVAMTEGKTPSSVPSRIVARTVAVCSGAVAVIAGRDLFFPGEILDFIPRDDIYLEWTNAFLHSPPEGTVEADENGILADLYVGDKFLSQFMAMNFLLLCMFKLVSGFGIRYGSDGGGEVKARMIWKAQFLGNALILFLFRLFTQAATSASLDLRWHLMFLAYETGIFALYGFL